MVIFSAPFWHVELPKKTETTKNLESKLHFKEQLVEGSIKDLRSKYNNGLISAELFIYKNDELTEKLQSLKEINSVTLKNSIDSQRIFVWKTPRAFILALGIRLPYLIFSLIISLLILDRRSDNKHTRRALNFLQVSCWSISTYLMIWVFWTSQDFPLDAYRYMFIAMSILIGTTVSFLISGYETTKEKLLEKIRYVMDIVLVKSSNHVKDQARWDEDIVEPTLTKLDE